MKRRTALLLALAVVLIIAALFLLAPGTATSTRQKIRLPDGNIVSLEKVTFSADGRHDFSFDDSGLARLRRNVPKFLRRYFPSRGMMSWTTSSNSLVLWFTMADAKTNAPLDFHGCLIPEVVDEHGCSFELLTYGSMSSSASPTMHTTTFTQFPRRQAVIRVRLRARPVAGTPRKEGDTNKIVAEFEVPNPARGPFPRWTPEPLPASRTNAELVFVLKDSGGLSPVFRKRPQFDILRDGVPARDWEDEAPNFSDATGNRGARLFCTNERVWKLEVAFRRNAQAAFLASEMFTITNLIVPGNGVAVTFTNKFSVQGSQFEMCAFAGPGHFVYSNTVVTIAEPLLSSQSGWTSSSSTYQGTTPICHMDISRKEPHVALLAPSFADDQRLLVRARFANGVARKLDLGPSSGHLRLFMLFGVTNAGPFDLDVIVHRVRHAEFFVKAPGK